MSPDLLLLVVAHLAVALAGWSGYHLAARSGGVGGPRHARYARVFWCSAAALSLCLLALAYGRWPPAGP